MIEDGERIKVLLSGAKHRVILCSPFIKAGVLRTIMSVVSDIVPIRVVTRWRAAEVAAGVSDLDTLSIANERPNAKLALLDDLHAKLYLADDQCLVGSANLTATALGWAHRNNVELLVPIEPSEPDIVHLLGRLESAVPATAAIRSKLEAKVATLQTSTLDEAQEIVDDGRDRTSFWLPRCAAPDKLYEMHLNPRTTVVVESTKSDGLADLRDLQIHSSRSSTDFEAAVRNSLLRMPAFSRIIEEVPKASRTPVALYV